MAPQQQPNGTTKPAFNTIPEAIEAFGSSLTLPFPKTQPKHPRKVDKEELSN
jgi:hypothetical protein